MGELNGLKVWSTDIGNAHLETHTKEKVCIIAGIEFGDHEGHVLIVSKALCGLHSSGLRWSEHLADVLREMGFFTSHCEKDIWIRDKGDHCEHIVVCVDDLMVASKDPDSIVKMLMEKCQFKLKGTGPTEFHLGCDFFRDEEGVLCHVPKKHIEKILENCRLIFGAWPKPATSPLTAGDHPKLDTSELLNEDNQKVCQSLIGALHWVIQIGRFDIQTTVMTLSRYRAMPRQGHLDRVKRIHGYLSKMRHATIKIRTDAPDYSNIPVKLHDWECSCYADAKEEIPLDAPTPKGKPVTMTLFFDANLHHDRISGKSVTGILHQLNKTPIDWHSKSQSTVETATFGSEHVAARTCSEQVIDLRPTLRYLGAPFNGPTMVLGDNELVINSSAIPHSKMHKRWVALSYHRVRHAVAAGIVNVPHIAGKKNPADILSKHWDLPSVWNTMKPLLFWNWKLMAPRAEEAKEGSNIEQKDVAKLVSKLDAKCNVKAAAQSKGQKNHILIEGSDNGAISPVIQSTNQSRVPSSRPRADVRPEGKDTRSNPERKVEQKR